jgi:hypothetical protein
VETGRATALSELSCPDAAGAAGAESKLPVREALRAERAAHQSLTVQAPSTTTAAAALTGAAYFTNRPTSCGADWEASALSLRTRCKYVTRDLPV